jgi:alpha-beta hydrolase superfamily lysophospholipase
MRRIGGLAKWAVLAGIALVAVVLVVRAVQAVGGPGLSRWHVYVPDEPAAAEIAGMDWAAWTAREDAIFAAVRAEVTDKLDSADQTPQNRYFADSPMNAARFAVDWNRSQVLEPDGPPKGAVVLVHGLTDSPYSLRHVAELYRARGFVAVLPRMPGHGTVPGGLGVAVWPDWLAATALAVREATARAGAGRPLHLVGYSNGGALVATYALEALDDPTLARPDQLVLISPMIGVTGFARFAGLAGWPAAIPAFVSAAWLDIVPEFNPFKYNSFPVQAAVQSHRLTQALHARLEAARRDGRMADFPPTLAFQSVVDSTVSAQAVVRELYDRLPANGSELVLFDLNRATALASTFRAAAAAEIERIVPPPPRAYDLVIVTNLPGEDAVVAEIQPAGGGAPERRPLGLAYPRDVFSLSHVALPFPVTDGLYGLAPDPSEDFGLNLGTLAPRGETGVLALGLDMFARLNSNPFYPALADEIVRRVDASAP